MDVGSVSNQYAYVGNGGVDLLATMQMMAQRQTSRMLAQRAADAAMVAAQAAQLAAMQAIGAGRVDLYV
jgi:hypothetical protein